MPRFKKSLEEKRRELRGSVVKGYFESKRASHEAYTDTALAAVIVSEKWEKAKPVAKMLVTEKIADWLGEMARSATEEARRSDQPEIPGVILYHDTSSGTRQRKSIRSSTLSEVKSYASILSAHAAGAVAELRKVQMIVLRAEEAGCREDEEVWPYISNEPRLPTEPGSGAEPETEDRHPVT